MGRSLSIKMVHEKCHTTDDKLQSNGLNLEEIKRKGCVTLSQVAVMKNDILNPFHQLLLLEKEIKSFILNKTKSKFQIIINTIPLLDYRKGYLLKCKIIAKIPKKHFT